MPKTRTFEFNFGVEGKNNNESDAIPSVTVGEAQVAMLVSCDYVDEYLKVRVPREALGPHKGEIGDGSAL